MVRSVTPVPSVMDVAKANRPDKAKGGSLG